MPSKKLAPKEVEKVQFFALEDIQKMINSGDKFHPEFVLSWEKGIITKAADTPVSNSRE